MNVNFFAYPFQILAIMIAMTLHEFVKALLSTRLGDTTPKTLGRLTLNPFKQIEIIGFLLMLIFGYGWSLPMETNAMMYKDRKRDTIITYTVPSLVNLLLGVMFVFVAIVFKQSIGENATNFLFYAQIKTFFVSMARYNVALALVNIIPVYPFDGWRVLSMFLSPNTRVKMSNNEKIFQIVFVLLLISGVLGMILNLFLFSVCGSILTPIF